MNITIKYNPKNKKYEVQGYTKKGEYLESMLAGIYELLSETVRDNFEKDFEEFLFDDSQEDYGSNETHIDKKGTVFVIYPFLEEEVIVTKRAFYELYFELKRSFDEKVPLITITWDGKVFSVDTHKKEQ
jgi:hypothetical protein